MKTQAEIENHLKKLKPVLAEKFHISKIGYFGSFANNEQSENSDLDLLVEFSQNLG